MRNDLPNFPGRLFELCLILAVTAFAVGLPAMAPAATCRTTSR